MAQAYRAPTLSELYNSGLHFAGVPPVPPFFPGFPDNFFVPNPTLRPESSTQLEIGARFEGGDMFRAGDRLSLAANAYYATVDDYIEQTVSVFAGTTTSANVASATLWGFEAEADYDAEAWFVGMGLSIARGENDAGGWLGSIPQDRLTLEAGVRPWEDWELGARATFAAAQTRVPAAGTYRATATSLLVSLRDAGHPRVAPPAMQPSAFADLITFSTGITRSTQWPCLSRPVAWEISASFHF